MDEEMSHEEVVLTALLRICEDLQEITALLKRQNDLLVTQNTILSAEQAYTEVDFIDTSLH